jgi:drug/metabolite transporter (DMT)-like permease
LLTGAVRRAPVCQVAPFDYSQVLWAALLGYFVWGDAPSPSGLAGSAVIAACGAYVLW